MKKIKKVTDRDFKNWSKGFTMTVLTLLTTFWFIFMAYSGVLMLLAIYRTGEFSFLDTYINRICDCFMAGVITGLVTRTIGNVFEFNDGGIFGVSHGDALNVPEEDTYEETEEENEANLDTFSEAINNLSDIASKEAARTDDSIKETPKKKGWWRR